MVRKLISFLGTGNYIECHYEYGGKVLEPQNFIQAAIAEGECRNWEDTDEIVILLTPSAKEKNWKSHHGNQGLKDILDGMNLKPQITALELAENIENFENWDQLFNEIFDVIQDEDEIYFDITHGFRALPFLTQTILNYARVIKKITIGKIMYGNFAKLGPAFQVEAIPLSDRVAPIDDLTEIMSLEIWTEAAESFISSGDSYRLDKLTQAEAAPILQQTYSQEAITIKNFTKSLHEFTANIQTVRMQEFPKSVKKLRDQYEAVIQLSSIGSNNFKFLTRLLEKIDQDLSYFTEDIIMDQYYAAEWAMKKGLIQQGYTILQEHLTSSVMLAVGYNHFNNYYLTTKQRDLNPLIPLKLERPIREAVKLAILYVQNKNSQYIPTGPMKKIFEKSVALIEPYQEILSETNILVQYRNNINHAGIAQGSVVTPNHLEDQLDHLIKTTKPFFTAMSEIAQGWSVDQVEAHLNALNPKKDGKATMFILLSHTLTDSQKLDAKQNLKVSEFVTLPKELQAIWSKIDPAKETGISEKLDKIFDWILNYKTSNQKILLVQGEPGATLRTVLWAHRKGMKSYYSTSHRVVKETKAIDDKVKSEREFKHIGFREFSVD